MGGKHEAVGPSSAPKWSQCLASSRMEKDFGQKDDGNYYADQGTAWHFLAEQVLTAKDSPVHTGGVPMVPHDLIGRTIYVNNGDASLEEDVTAKRCFGFEIDTEMADGVGEYVAIVRSAPFGSIIDIEVKVDISTITGKADATGTADCVTITPDGELIVRDLKGGMCYVSVDTPQLLVYAAGVFDLYSLVAEINKVTLQICQPRLRSYPSVTYSVKEFLALVDDLRVKAHEANRLLSSSVTELADHLNPGPHCVDHYCKARANCRAFAAWATEDVEEDTLGIDIPRLAKLAKKLDTVRGWCDAIEERLNNLVLSGEPVPGFKAVEGRKGDREWADLSIVEMNLANYGLKYTNIYETKTKSPAEIKKYIKGKDPLLTPEQWRMLEAYITQAPPKPVVVSSDDPRPALELSPLLDLFDDIS